MVVIAIYFRELSAHFSGQWWVPSALLWNTFALAFAGGVLAFSPHSLSYKLLFMPFIVSFILNAAFTRSHLFAVINVAFAFLTLYTTLCLDGLQPKSVFNVDYSLIVLTGLEIQLFVVGIQSH
jgi:hypothetical protein